MRKDQTRREKTRLKTFEMYEHCRLFKKNCNELKRWDQIRRDHTRSEENKRNIGLNAEDDCHSEDMWPWEKKNFNKTWQVLKKICEHLRWDETRKYKIWRQRDQKRRHLNIWRDLWTSELIRNHSRWFKDKIIVKGRNETRCEQTKIFEKSVCQHLTTFKMKIHTWRFKDIEKKTRQTGGD